MNLKKNKHQKNKKLSNQKFRIYTLKMKNYRIYLRLKIMKQINYKNDLKKITSNLISNYKK